MEFTEEVLAPARERARRIGRQRSIAALGGLRGHEGKDVRDEREAVRRREQPFFPREGRAD